jgi:hypothetical protein
VALSIKLIVSMDFFFKLGPLKISISQPLWNADYIGPEGCEIEIFNGSIFLTLSSTKYGLNIKNIPDVAKSLPKAIPFL